MARLRLGLKEGSEALSACTREVKSKIAELAPGLEKGDDIIKYVVFLANRSHKTKQQMREALEAFFEDKSDEMVNWLWSDLRSLLPLKPPKPPKPPTVRPAKESEERPPAPVADLKKRRCRYWPNCERADCLFHHPDTPCPHFPNCRYGKACLHIHPDCKYGEACRNPNCAYTHKVSREKSLDR